MPSTIPYSPSLTLGSVITPSVMEALTKISHAQAPIDAAQENLSSLISLRRSLDMTRQELVDMRISPAELDASLIKVNADIDAAASHYAAVRMTQEDALLELRTGMPPVMASPESPVDFNHERTQIKQVAIGADNLKLEVQYFSFNENAQDARNQLNKVRGFITATASTAGSDANGASLELANAATEQISQQISTHNIAGTLVIAASCTHRNASMLAPLYLDVDKATLWREAAQAAGLRHNQGLSCWVLAQRAELLYLQRDHHAASAAYAEAMEAALSHGQQELGAICGVYVALDHASRGQLDVCRRQLEQAWLAADQSGGIQARLFVLMHLGSCYARQGDANGLDQCLIRLGAPALALCPLGQAVSQWLQGRRYLMEDQPSLALPLILQAHRTLNEMGAWCPDESWILLAHVAMCARERRVLVDTLEEMERNDQVSNVAWRRVCTIVLRSMVSYFDADAQAALQDIELAIPLARNTSLAPMLQFAQVWLCLLSERPQALDALAGAGDWVVHTREGRYLQAVLQDHHRWTWRPRQLPLMLTSGSGGGVYSHLIADLGDEEPTRYVDHLPLPI